MTDEQMRRYLAEVGNRLEARGLVGEIVLAGGAVMVMALHARGGSRDIDAVFVKEADGIRDAAREVARAHGLPDAWLNDQVRVSLLRVRQRSSSSLCPGCAYGWSDSTISST